MWWSNWTRSEESARRSRRGGPERSLHSGVAQGFLRTCYSLLVVRRFGGSAHGRCEGPMRDERGPTMVWYKNFFRYLKTETSLKISL
jgi:hypothetical protein